MFDGIGDFEFSENKTAYLPNNTFYITLYRDRGIPLCLKCK